MSPQMQSRADNFREWSWALFEWARNPYYNLVIIYIFGPYFTREVIGDPIWGQALWGYINGFGGLAVALCAPFIGAVADHIGRRKPGLLAALLVMSPAMFILWFAEPGAATSTIYLLAFTITVAGVCYAISEVLHNSMLVAVAPQTMGRASGRGLALGNAASVLLLATILYGIALPASDMGHWSWLPDSTWFGLDAQAHEHNRIVGPILSVWILVFSLPLLLWVPDVPRGLPLGRAVRRGLGDLLDTLRQARRYNNIIRYLVARMLFNDGKLAIMTFGTIYAVSVFDWGIVEVLILGILLSVVAVVGGLVGGMMDQRWGSRRPLLLYLMMIALCLLMTLSLGKSSVGFVYVAGLDEPVWSLPWFSTLPELMYVLLSFLYALFITAAYASSRTLLARIAPADALTRFFGLYALSGQVTAFAAPLAIAVLTQLSGSQRGGLVVVFVFLLGGAALLLGVRETADAGGGDDEGIFTGS